MFAVERAQSPDSESCFDSPSKMMLSPPPPPLRRKQLISAPLRSVLLNNLDELGAPSIPCSSSSSPFDTENSFQSSIPSPPLHHHSSSFSAKMEQNPLLRQAFARMQDKAKSLKRQRDEQQDKSLEASFSALLQHEEEVVSPPVEKRALTTAAMKYSTTKKSHQGSNSHKEELTTNERVALGRQPPERQKSDMARSA